MEKIILPFEDIVTRNIPELQDKTLTITEEQALSLAKYLTLVDCEFWDYKDFIGKTYFDAAYL